jgi:hypothetical protein
MKKDLMEDDRDRDAWLGPMLRRTPLAPAGPCVDAETLAAWGDGKLDATQAAAVELHASNCPRCMATLAAIERTTPAVDATEDRAWALGPLWRWIVPLTAAATAVAIWIAVPDRPVTQAPAAIPQESARPSQEEAQVPPSVPPTPNALPEPGAPSTAPMPSTPAPEANVAPPDQSAERLEEKNTPQMLRDDAQLRETDKRERAAVDAFSAPAAAPAAPGTAPSPPPARVAPEPAPLAAERRAIVPPSAGAAGAAADAIDQMSPLAARQSAAPTEPIVTNMTTSASNPLVKWRVLDWMSVERSIDGGATWIKATLPPGVSPESSPRRYVVSVRAVDNLRGVVLTSDRREFYTVNGGVSWEAVQENSAAPF